jgi:hypothetical protein
LIADMLKARSGGTHSNPYVERLRRLRLGEVLLIFTDQGFQDSQRKKTHAFSSFSLSDMCGAIGVNPGSNGEDD